MNKCKCGCGEKVARNFCPGHDTKLRTKIERKAGGIFNLKELVNAAQLYTEGIITDGELHDIIKRIFSSNVVK